MKKFLCALCVFVLLLSFSGCAVIMRAINEKTVEDVVEEELFPQTPLDDFFEEEVSLPAFEERVVFEEQGIKITAKGIEKDTFGGFEIKLLFENNSEENIKVTLDNCSVNSLMLTDFVYLQMLAGKKANETISVSTFDVEELGIEEIWEYEFLVTVQNDDYEDLVLNCPVKVTVKDGFEKEAFEGTTVFEQEGIKITAVNLVEDPFGGYDLFFAVENNYSAPITVSFENVSVNDFAVNGFFWARVASCKVALESLNFSSSDIENNEITAVEEVEFSIEIENSEDYETLFQAENVVLTFS